MNRPRRTDPLFEVEAKAVLRDGLRYRGTVIHLSMSRESRVYVVASCCFVLIFSRFCTPIKLNHSAFVNLANVSLFNFIGQMIPGIYHPLIFGIHISAQLAPVP